MNEKPLVGVCMIAYNQEDFIAQAIEGVLMQKTDFDLELVIGEDYSTDETRKICNEYKKQFPDKIRILARERNLGMPTNFADTLENCLGKYVALCEGDDYWTDPLKIQKQIDFLEKNRDFAICFHNADVLDDNTGNISEDCFYLNQRDVTEFVDLLTTGGHYIPTASCVFRNNLFERFPDFFYKYGLDIILYLLNARHGKLKFIDETMSVYRVHRNSYSSSEGRLKQLNFVIGAMTEAKNYFHPSYENEFELYIARTKSDIAMVSFGNGENNLFAVNYAKAMEYRDYLPRRTKRALRLRYLIKHSNLLSRWFISLNPKSKTS